MLGVLGAFLGLNEFVRLLHRLPSQLLKFSASLLSRQACRDGYAFMVRDDPRLSGVDESSQSGASFPESGASLEDVVMHHGAYILREWNAGLESERLQRCDVLRRHP